jgi:sugar transferase (PEP-CTERM/EpsH1 system associated)
VEPRIHVQHVVLSLEPGGLENGVVNVVNRLDPGRFRSSVCCLKLAGEFAMRLKAGEVAVHALGWRGGIDLLLPLRLAALFRKTGTDIVHTRNPTAFFYGFLGAKIAAVRSIVHSEHGRTFDERRLRFWMQRVFSRHTDALFAVSAQLKRDLVAKVGIPACRIEVLYNGVDLGRYVPAQRDRLRGELGLEPGDFVIGSVGRLVTVKNYPLLLQAARGLENGNLAILLVGEGPERGTLEAMAREFGLGAHVRFLGHREDIAELLGAMDAFVLPSLSEGMSNTLLEAMASGVAVVASDVGGNPEIVSDGIDGLLFRSRDEAGLREKLQELLANPALRMRLGRAGRERVLRDFSIEAMISRYETLYQTVFSA